MDVRALIWVLICALVPALGRECTGACQGCQENLGLPARSWAPAYGTRLPD
jgi:hypothetical protein